MSGAARGPAAAALRLGLSLIEPVYAAAASARNRSYDRHPDRARRLPRSVISVGNITTGGTGKTPVVRWLAERLRARDRNVAILSRGYKAVPGTLGDEQRMLDRLLNQRDSPAAAPLRPVGLFADPDRFAVGSAALSRHPDIDVLLLDDGFQHRRLARDLDLVLVHATEPFGFGHVLPRGLLREPLAGLGRADAFILTHADAVSPEERSQIERELRRYNATAPVYAAVHAPVALREARAARGPAGEPTTETTDADDAPETQDIEHPLERLATARVFAFCGIGNPTGFERELRRSCGQYAGHRWFPDHHAFTAADLREVRAAAARAGADVLVTTEKDWVKLAALADAPAGHRNGEPGAAPPGSRIPVWRLDVTARFLGDDGDRLLARIGAVVSHAGGGPNR